MDEGPPLDAAALAEHDRVYSEGWRLVRGELLTTGPGGAHGPEGPPGLLARRRLLRAIECFTRALAIHPAGWQSHWALGKIHQRLGDLPRAIECLARAQAQNPAHPDMPREISLMALEVGDTDAAVRFSRIAAQSAPQDHGLLSNLALALLFSGELDEARATIAQVIARAPQDRIALAVGALVEDVAAGRRPRPKSGRDLAGPA